MLYTTYRPQVFSEVVGQEENLITLREQTKLNKFDSAYLFTGHRGTGKTTIARILARTICCDNPTEDGPCNQCDHCKAILNNKTLDFIELDAASHNSISDIKDLVTSTRYLPTVLPKKIYIIDEVHNLSGSAFDALLKTIEEPPQHCIFILCTTELHKIPATIRSRCSIYPFTTLSIEAISDRLIHVLTDLDKDYEMDAVNLIAKQADGSMRDALSIAEKLIISCDTLTSEHVKNTLCLMDDTISVQLLSAIIHTDGKKAISLLQDLYEEGKNLSQLVDNLLQCLTDSIVLYSAAGNAVIYNTEEYKTELYDLIKNCQLELLFWYVDQFCTLRERIRNSYNPYTDVLLYIIKCCNPKLMNDSASAILTRLSSLEKAVSSLQKEPLNFSDEMSLKKADRQSMTNQEKILVKEEKEDKRSDGWKEPDDPIPFDQKDKDQEEESHKCDDKRNEENSREGTVVKPDDEQEQDDEILSLLSDYL